MNERPLHIDELGAWPSMKPMKYYRPDESGCFLKFKGVPVEVDEWKKASEPPKPEDFGPSGQVNLIDQMSCKTATVYAEDLQEIEGDWTHWRRISPPNL